MTLYPCAQDELVRKPKHLPLRSGTGSRPRTWRLWHRGARSFEKRLPRRGRVLTLSGGLASQGPLSKQELSRALFLSFFYLSLSLSPFSNPSPKTGAAVVPADCGCAPRGLMRGASAKIAFAQRNVLQKSCGQMRRLRKAFFATMRQPQK